MDTGVASSIYIIYKFKITSKNIRKKKAHSDAIHCSYVIMKIKKEFVEKQTGANVTLSCCAVYLNFWLLLRNIRSEFIGIYLFPFYFDFICRL